MYDGKMGVGMTRIVLHNLVKDFEVNQSQHVVSLSDCKQNLDLFVSLNDAKICISCFGEQGTKTQNIQEEPSAVGFSSCCWLRR